MQQPTVSLGQESQVDTSNRFTGLASRVGILDRGGDVIAPGAFAGCLARFLAGGFIALSHDWDNLPIAMPISAIEVPSGLRVVGEFHSHPAAQAARSVVRERAAHGLKVGLSVGFRTRPNDWTAYASGRELLRDAARRGIELLDPRAIEAHAGRCRLVRRVEELFEVSLVAVPMNPGARVLQATSSAVLDLHRARLAAQAQVNRARINRARLNRF